MYSSNPRRVGIYNTYTWVSRWASIHMGSIYSNRSKGNGEDFLNEVMGISQTSHVNIVSLLGFCLEGSKRALIYEYMPNGSLDKHIYSELAIGWEMLLKIAIGIARGLESCIRDATLTSYISISNLKTSF